MMTGYSIAFAPYLPVWGLLVLAAVAILMFGWLLVRQMPGTLFRAGLAALLLLGLANPALLQERRELNPDVALLIVDETPSQSAVGRLEETRAAAEAVQAQLAQFAPSLEVRRVVLRHSTVQDSAQGTRVVEATRDALADVPARRYAGAILITDGQIHDPQELASLPPGPLHALIDGARNTPDRRLQIVKAPSFGVVDEPLELTLRISDPTVGP
ncbi:MAG TPA: hypothetical protein DCG04_00005, partial [Rhodospirillaceae bacterium]|nr:hypothetical protein [Rhodospirillaceae bacterium]